MVLVSLLCCGFFLSGVSCFLLASLGGFVVPRIFGTQRGFFGYNVLGKCAFGDTKKLFLMQKGFSWDSKGFLVIQRVCRDTFFI